MKKFIKFILNGSNAFCNSILIVIFCILSLFFLINCFYKIECNFEGLFITFIGSIIPAIFTIISLAKWCCKSKDQQNNLNNSDDSKCSDDISRETDITNLKLELEKTNFIILSGESGSGKSKLVEMLKDDLKNVKIYSHYKVKVDSIKNDLDKLDYIIFDQFERALFRENAKDYISYLKKLNKNSIIVVRKDFLGDVYNLFQDLRIQPTISYLTNKYVEDNEIKIFGSKILSNNDVTDEIINKITDDFKNEKLNFIKLKLIYKLIKDGDYKKYEKELNNGDYYEIIKNYFKEKIDNYQKKESAYRILYLLSRSYFNKKDYFGVEDFKNILFISNEEEIIGIIKYLIEIGLIREVNENKYAEEKKVNTYDFVHDFLQEVVDDICVDNTNLETRGVIDFYNKKCQKDNNFKDSILKKFDNYKNDKRVFLHICLFIFIIIMLIISINNGYNISEYNNLNLLKLTLLYFVLLGSVLFVYNFYYYFLVLFCNKYCWWILYAIFCALPLLNLDIWNFSLLNWTFNPFKYWGMLLGLEITLCGLVMYLISFKTEGNVRKLFRKDAYIWGTIGIITLFISFGVPIGTSDKADIILLVLYVLFIGITDYRFVGEEYYNNLIGRVIYKDGIFE